MQEMQFSGPTPELLLPWAGVSLRTASPTGSCVMPALLVWGPPGRPLVQMGLVSMTRWAHLGRREERNARAWGPGEGERISQSPLIFLSNNQVLDNFKRPINPTTGDTIRSAPSARITSQRHSLCVLHFGRLSNYALTRAPGRQVWPCFTDVKTPERWTSAMVTPAIRVTSAGVPLPTLLLRKGLRFIQPPSQTKCTEMTPEGTHLRCWSQHTKG